MDILLSAASRKRVDAYTINEYGIPGEELVENAARAVEREAFGYEKVAVVCGYGNNGADGLAVARMLYARDVQVSVFLVGDSNKATSLWQYEMCILPAGIKIRREIGELDAELIIDGLFGIGLNREVSGEYRDAIVAMNMYKQMTGCKIIAIDMPSGVNTDTGAIMGDAVKADITVAFGYKAPGHILYPGANYVGELKCADIKLVSADMAGEKAVAYTGYAGAYPAHAMDTHKGSYGRLYMLTGSIGMAGAALLSGKAAYRAGCGLVYIDTPEENRVILQLGLPEAVLVSRYDPEKYARAAVAGCGLSTERRAYHKLTELMMNTEKIVLDADALNMLASSQELKSLVKLKGRVIMTPHIGELSRLLNCSTDEIKKDMLAAAKRAATEYNAICIAKSARTVIAFPSDRPSFINVKGNPGMATAGSGDVLAGIIGGLLARGLSPEDASVLGVITHAEAGDNAANTYGMSHMMAGDIIDKMSRITRNWN